MPSWSIHLAVAKKVNENLKLNDELFFYGNLIPDVSTLYVIIFTIVPSFLLE